MNFVHSTASVLFGEKIKSLQIKDPNRDRLFEPVGKGVCDIQSILEKKISFFGDGILLCMTGCL